MAETTEMVRDFSKVVLTLDNVLVPPDKLSTTPSMQDGLDAEKELDLRILGCELIQTSGILLKLPQVAMATGQLVFQRFYYSKSFVKHNMEVLAMACVNLASKIEEAPRRIRDVINVFHHIKQVRNRKTIFPLILDQNYVNLKNQVIKAERRILKELGFCVHIKHPHKIIVTYLQVLECNQNQRFVQCAWNYMNDSFRTSVFVTYQPETIACACIYLAARQLRIPLPTEPSWYSLFMVNESELQDISRSILSLYLRKKPNVDELEKVVNDCKKLHIEAKLKAKGLASEGATPNSSSRPATPARLSPALGLPSLRKLKDENGSDHSDFSGRLNHASRGKKRSHSKSHSGDSRSRSRSRSKSRSFRSSSRSRSPRSRSRSLSPVRKYKKESRKSTKDKYRDSKYSSKDYYKDYKDSRDYKDSNKDYYKDGREKDPYYNKDYYKYHPDYYDYKDNKDGLLAHIKHSTNKHSRPSPTYSPERSPSHSPVEYISSKSSHKKSYKDKEPYRSRSRSRDRHRASKKHHNGHRRSRSRERYTRR